MQSASTSPYKPSPLSYGSARTSPFKRPQSPTTIRGASPTTTPARPALEKPSNTAPGSSPASVVFSPRSPIPVFNPGAKTSSRGTTVTRAPSGNFKPSPDDPLSRVHPNQLHSLRESFQLLDGDNDGQVTRDDVAEMLTQLGQDASAAALAPFFPPGAPSSLNLASYLNTLSALLAALSQPDELGAAFAAFDVDDSGQVDAAELREALMHGEAALDEREVNSVLEGFSGRRAFAKGMGAGAGSRGQVFRYHEFMASVSGSGRVGAQDGAAEGATA